MSTFRILIKIKTLNFHNGVEKKEEKLLVIRIQQTIISYKNTILFVLHFLYLNN